MRSIHLFGTKAKRGRLTFVFKCKNCGKFMCSGLYDIEEPFNIHGTEFVEALKGPPEDHEKAMRRYGLSKTAELRRKREAWKRRNSEPPKLVSLQLIVRRSPFRARRISALRLRFGCRHGANRVGQDFCPVLPPPRLPQISRSSGGELLFGERRPPAIEPAAGTRLRVDRQREDRAAEQLP